MTRKYRHDKLYENASPDLRQMMDGCVDGYEAYKAGVPLSECPMPMETYGRWWKTAWTNAYREKTTGSIHPAKRGER